MLSNPLSVPFITLRLFCSKPQHVPNILLTCNFPHNLVHSDMMSPDMFQVTSGQDSEKFNEGDQQPSSQLRQRRVKGEVPQQSKDTSPVDSIQTVGGMDPIRWFSALPPMSLRNAQKRFKEGRKTTHFICWFPSMHVLFLPRTTNCCVNGYCTF